MLVDNGVINSLVKGLRKILRNQKYKSLTETETILILRLIRKHFTKLLKYFEKATTKNLKINCKLDQ